MSWIGVDLDGTLSKSVRSLNDGIGDPVPSMLSRVKKWLKDGREVRIVTARASTPRQVTHIRAWLKRHGLEDCDITDRKDADMAELWDDRAIRVERDSGTICRGCKPNTRNHASSISTADQSGFVLTDC